MTTKHEYLKRPIAGLDLSLTSTGWSCGTFQTAIQPKTIGAQRLVEVREAILALVVSSNMPFVVMEGYAFATRNSQAYSIGELGGVIRAAFWEWSIPFVEVPPTCRAKFATGRGNASKSEVVSAVSARTGIAWSGKGADDMCDAWVLEEMGLTSVGKGRYDWPLANIDALNKIHWTPLQDYCLYGESEGNL